MTGATITQLVDARNVIYLKQKELYLATISNINIRNRELLKNDLGNVFIKNCGRDIAGEVVRNCFDTSDYNITVDQLARRILEFNYETDYDPLAENCGVGSPIKSVLNYNDNPKTSAELREIENVFNGIENQSKLFNEDRSVSTTDTKREEAYRNSQVRNIHTDENGQLTGELTDEITGETYQTTTYPNSKTRWYAKGLQADHVQAWNAAMYNKRYLTGAGVEELRTFYNSDDNLEMMFGAANGSKGDIRVCNVNGKIEFHNARSDNYDPSTDITYKATPEQLADAVCSQWTKVDQSREQKSNPRINKLIEKGYLNEDGTVPKSVRNALVQNIKHSQNVESVIILKNTDYNKAAKDSLSQTKASVGKIIAGQIIYYAAPPLVYEIKTILKDKTIMLENALKKIAAAGKRICKYVFSKIKDIFTNIIANSLKRFIKSFMDILISTVKAAVKKLLKMAKSLVLSVVDSIRIIADKRASRAEKADSVFNLFGVTITSCVIEVLFELAGNVLHIPEPLDDIIFGPLQILTTIICTNLVMLILQKADLFNVRYGLLVANIDRVFDEEFNKFQVDCDLLQQESDIVQESIMDSIKKQISDIKHNLEIANLYEDDVSESLNQLNQIFDMGIDYQKEWSDFVGGVVTC